MVIIIWRFIIKASVFSFTLGLQNLRTGPAHDPYTVYPVEYFSKREYPSGNSKVTPSASYDRYAATTRLPNRELPSSISPGADYMSRRSYLDQVPTDRYSSRGTLQLGLSRAGNSNVQQLGITRAGNSNAYDYTEVHFQCVSLPLLCKWPSPDMFPLETWNHIYDCCIMSIFFHDGSDVWKKDQNILEYVMVIQIYPSVLCPL
jgi:hypothetical protein